jgi:hypothetical protein
MSAPALPDWQKWKLVYGDDIHIACSACAVHWTKARSVLLVYAFCFWHKWVSLMNRCPGQRVVLSYEGSE